MLDDVRVIDATQVVAGSFASMSLADLGADVVKVERPDGGDIGRSTPPFVDGWASYYASVNRGKRSVALDLSSDRGRDAFLALAEDADVVVENHPTGRMDGFGLGYDDVRERNPGIVYCSITGFGQTGPYAELPALDMVVQAMSGHMSFTGPPDGPPYRAGLPVGDIAGSMYAVQAIIAALYRRATTDEGQHVDVSMLESMLSWMTVRAGYTFAEDEPYPRTGNQLEEFVPYNAYETADGYLVIITVTDRHWRRLCDVIDRPDLADDDRFATMADRTDHRDEVNALLEETLADRAAVEWFEDLADHGVPSAPVYDTLEVWDDDHVQDRGVLLDVPLGGEPFHAIDYPARFSDAEAGPRRGVPALGEHTREALRAAGYDDGTIDDLREAGVVAEPDD